MNDEYDGGMVDNHCPDCGQFCKMPDYYRCYFGETPPEPTWSLPFKGCYADSYCKRCKKEVQLSVEFI